MTETKEQLLDQLRGAFDAGDASRIAELQTALANLKVESIGERAANLKDKIITANQQISELQIEQSVMEEHRKTLNAELIKAMDAYQEAVYAVNSADAALYGVDAMLENYREMRRDAQNDLKDLTNQTIEIFDTQKGEN
jgi:predicted nuclease with TOPRIM domain